MILAFVKQRKIKLALYKNIFITLIDVENVQSLLLANRGSTILPLELLILS